MFNIVFIVMVLFSAGTDVKWLGKEQIPNDVTIREERSIQFKPYLTINHGHGSNELPHLEYDYFGPDVFIVDSNSNFYILESKTVYKFTPAGMMVASRSFKSFVLDMALEGGKIYAYMGRSLLCLDTIGLSISDTLSLGGWKGEDMKVSNVSYFSNGNLFLNGIDMHSFGVRLRYIYNLRQRTMTNLIESDDQFSVMLPGCAHCDVRFLQRFFDGLSRLRYLGQGRRYAFVSYACSPVIHGDTCGKVTRKYYLFDKHEYELAPLGDKFDSCVGSKITKICSHPIFFQSDSVVFVQTLDHPRKGTETYTLTYYKINL
jgi:hypothetical protein